MNKHTPGPWRATNFSSVVGCPITAQPDKTKNTVVIAGVHGAAGDDYRAEVEANARLIAAAPDMAEALRKAAAQFRLYERLHAAKGTPDGNEKARTNAVMAAECEAALTKAGASDE